MHMNNKSTSNESITFINEFDNYVIHEGLMSDPIDDIISLGDYLFEEMDNFTIEDDILQEASGSKVSTAKNIFKKIIEYIKKFFQFIAKFFKAIISKIFGKGEASATSDQIAAEVVGDVPESEGTENIRFEAGPGSVFGTKEISLIAKDIDMKIKDKKIEMRPLGFKGGVFKKHKVAKPAMTGNLVQVPMAMLYFKNDQLRHDFNKFITDLVDGYEANNIGAKNGAFDATLDDIKYRDDINEQWGKIAVHFEQLPSTFDQIRGLFVRKSAKELEEMYKEINNYALKLNKIPDNDLGVFTIPGQIKHVIQEVTSVLQAITYGCNQIMRHVKHMYMIDKKYAHAINDINTLGQFVNKLIEAGIPSNYVAYNCWCIMGEDLDNRGYFSKKKLIGVNGPRWGQSRVTFFPAESSGRDGEVLKIAMNGAGILGNKTELNRYKSYDKHGDAGQLARPIDQWADGTIISMERLTPYKPSEIFEARRAADKMKSEYGTVLFGQGINDIHWKNVAKDIDGNPKLIDYAS